MPMTPELRMLFALLAGATVFVVLTACGAVPAAPEPLTRQDQAATCDLGLLRGSHLMRCGDELRRRPSWGVL